MATITSANSVLMLGVVGLFPTAQQMQGFAADAAFDTASVETAEVRMGVDARMSGGYTPAIKMMTINLQADSPSIAFWDALVGATEANREVIQMFGNVILPSVGKKYQLVNGILRTYAVIPPVRKLLEPQVYEVAWERIIAAPV